ncbi:MAG: PaaI family thioesterase [Proteobacteria bacterium]|nr:PaaI family thioesterase [Pseudomonadota bacterium]MBU1902960.1 PaaI family thioesterase [Pseudomonadota bacterium]
MENNIVEEEKRVDIQKPEGHYCFACGTENPIGLNLKFYRLGDAVCSDITLGRYHEGWQNIAHGGIISTLLDEVMSWAIMYSKKTFLVTRKMDIKYVRNVSIGIPLTVTGKLVDDSAPPKIRARAEIRDDQGRLLVRSNGEFVALSGKQFSSVPTSFKNQMSSLFESFE